MNQSNWESVRIRPARGNRALTRLVAMDRRIFGPSDVFTREQFAKSLNWFIEVGESDVGLIALMPDTDLDDRGHTFSMKSALYIASTGILPAWQHQGLGLVAKAFEVAYARTHGFTEVVAVCRSRNAPILRINEQFGFHVRHRLSNYYTQPPDDGLIMELLLG